jgi:hypothetical protein
MRAGQRQHDGGSTAGISIAVAWSDAPTTGDERIKATHLRAGGYEIGGDSRACLAKPEDGDHRPAAAHGRMAGRNDG